MERTSTGTILRCAAACASRGRPRRRRLCLRSPPPRPPDTAPFSPQPSCTARAAPPRARPFVSPLWPLRMARVCVQQNGWTALIEASARGREGCVRLLIASEANVNATHVSLERPLQAHAMGQLPCSDFVCVLPSVFRTTENQLCIGQQATATSRSPSFFSKAAPIRLFKTGGARRPSTSHGSGHGLDRARSWPC